LIYGILSPNFRNPAGGQHPDTGDRLQAFGCRGPTLVLAQGDGMLTFTFSDLGIQRHEEAVHPSLDIGNHPRLTQECVCWFRTWAWM
jgi:hypothetical protein